MGASVDTNGVQFAVLIGWLFQARICLKNRISTEPNIPIKSYVHRCGEVEQ